MSHCLCKAVAALRRLDHATRRAAWLQHIGMLYMRMVIKGVASGLADNRPFHLFLFRSLLIAVAEATLAGDNGLSGCVLAAESLQSSPSLTSLKFCGEL
jgi:hypothetical protein